MRKGGVTLIDVLVFAVIVTILAAVAIPAYNGYKIRSLQKRANYKITMKTNFPIVYGKRQRQHTLKDLYFNKYREENNHIVVQHKYYNDFGDIVILKDNILTFKINPYLNDAVKINIKKPTFKNKEEVKENDRFVIKEKGICNVTGDGKNILNIQKSDIKSIKNDFKINLIIHFSDNSTINIFCDSYVEGFGGVVKCYRGVDDNKQIYKEFKNLDYSYIEVVYTEAN